MTRALQAAFEGDHETLRLLAASAPWLFRSSTASSRGLGLQVWPSAAAVPYWLRESLGMYPPIGVDDLEAATSPSGRSGPAYDHYHWGALKCAKRLGDEPAPGSHCSAALSSASLACPSCRPPAG